MKPLLAVSGISKSYRIENNFFNPRQKWVLKNLSFEIEQGECMGIIGRNGAGKSTLLKIIAGITEATKGTVVRSGRIASLIELGNGFHPELSGMENLKFNAALLGMNRLEIKRKTDEIIAFAQLEEVIHRPVGSYSTGMAMRLGFSIAAHLETEIVILDEVLAVGDSFFQQKCIERILAMRAEGRTVLVVTHQAELIRRLCSRALWLENGTLKHIGQPNEVLNEYLGLHTALKGKTVFFNEKEKLFGFLKINWLEYPISTLSTVKFETTVLLPKAGIVDFGFNINDKEGRCLVHISNRFLHQKIQGIAGENKFQIEIENHLLPATYFLTCFLRLDEIIIDWQKNAIEFEVSGSIHQGYENPLEVQGFINAEFNIIKIE